MNTLKTIYFAIVCTVVSITVYEITDRPEPCPASHYVGINYRDCMNDVSIQREMQIQRNEGYSEASTEYSAIAQRIHDSYRGEIDAAIKAIEHLKKQNERLTDIIREGQYQSKIIDERPRHLGNEPMIITLDTGTLGEMFFNTDPDPETYGDCCDWFDVEYDSILKGLKPWPYK